ncbi:MAG TPA: phage head-tail connector protein [Pirellulaceae bacterium]|nr:phage head-tail connector protein [Pirellulaceae bacterium]
MALTDKVAFALLADLKSDLGISDASKDSTLERRILAASELIESWCGRRFRYQSVVENVKGEGWPSIAVSRLPVVAITSIVIDGSTIPSTAYSLVDAETGRIFRVDGWAWTAALIATASPERVTGTEERAFVVTYAGGYVLPNDSNQAPYASPVMLPNAIVEACLLWATELHLAAGTRGDVVQEQVGDASIAYAVNSTEERRGGQPSPAVTRLLAPYRVFS